MQQLIDRRELLKIASAALVGLTSAKTNWALPAGLVQNVGKAADWTPAFFNDHQIKTVMVLTELIIPRTDTAGANDANVHRYVDLFLSVANTSDQRKFVNGLAQLDESAKRQYKRDFVDCSEEEQVAILTPLAKGDAFFDQAKTMTSQIYFSTPEGYKELNKFGPPPTTLACEHPAGHSS